MKNKPGKPGGNKLVLMLNKRIVANLNPGEMFNLKSGEDPWKTDPKVCTGKETKEIKVCVLLETQDPKVCKPIPTDFGIPTHD